MWEGGKEGNTAWQQKLLYIHVCQCLRRLGVCLCAVDGIALGLIESRALAGPHFLP